MLSSEAPCAPRELLSSKNGRKKRCPAGTPDPDAEVVSLSPKTLLESDRYVCEICNQGFHRHQNLQMHRRRHKVPWKLMKRESPAAKRRVFVCPEPGCVHHDPSHALGDLVGVKKHFRRKHSGRKQWVCAKCSKGYAVHSDYKAHLKTCGTRGHSCDCGRVFSRVEGFIEHQDACKSGRLRSGNRPLQPPVFSSNPIVKFNVGVPPWLSSSPILPQPGNHPMFSVSDSLRRPNLDLQLSLGSSLAEASGAQTSTCPSAENGSSVAARLKEQADEQLRVAMRDRAYAEEMRRQARRQIELAEQELGSARRIRQLAAAEMVRAQALKEEAAKQINPLMLQITCHSCKHKFLQASASSHPMAK